jgi:hypothetical protein
MPEGLPDLSKLNPADLPDIDLEQFFKNQKDQ